MRKQRKYEKLIDWIDGLDGEFNLRQASETLNMSRQAISLTVLHFSKLGMMKRREVNRKVVFYSKSEVWDKQKAVEENYQRLKRKWQRYKKERVETSDDSLDQLFRSIGST